MSRELRDVARRDAAPDQQSGVPHDGVEHAGATFTDLMHGQLVMPLNVVDLERSVRMPLTAVVGDVISS